MSVEERTLKDILLGKLKEDFKNLFDISIVGRASTKYEVAQDVCRALLKVVVDLLRASPNVKDDYGFRATWTQSPEMRRMYTLSSFINYVEATFLEIQQSLRADDFTLEQIAVLMHLFLADAMLLLLPGHQCPSLDDLCTLAAEAEWCACMTPLSSAHWSADVVAIIEAAKGPQGQYVGLLNSSVRRLESEFIVKYGTNVTIKEAMAMEHIRRNTTVPVPRIHGVLCQAGRVHIVMECIDAEDLASLLERRAVDEDGIAEIIDQLTASVKEIRALGGPHQEITSWPFGLPCSGLFNPPPYQRITSLKEFYSYWEGRYDAADGYRGLKWRGEGQVDDGWELVLSHGDLAPPNIMVRGRQVVAVVDWETYGWYPDFWEGLMARRHHSEAWYRRVSEAMGIDGGVAEAFSQVLTAVGSKF
ncbi:kinase-like protein [Heliocybe sulcata]|uniref:Kinase-like protein n=1 Tax=Heliocybe sulcata TaxID=5364 RepID=A0A5C3N845_9AGAM|nr:kinase-like protein [Heliocybe sulcata]